MDTNKQSKRLVFSCEGSAKDYILRIVEQCKEEKRGTILLNNLSVSDNDQCLFLNNDNAAVHYFTDFFKEDFKNDALIMIAEK